MAIVVRNLTKRFSTRRRWGEAIVRPFHRQWVTVLDGVNLEVKRGEVFGLLGINGAGKTTLLKILCTLLLPTTGHVAVNGDDVVEVPQRVRQAVGYCLDTERSFYYRLTGMQNLGFFAAVNKLGMRKAKTRIDEVLTMVGLQEAARTTFMTYSRGMQQKLGLARALLTDPAVLLLDEPTKGLDYSAAAEFRRLLRRVVVDNPGKTVFVVTHSLEEVRMCCDRVAILEQGRIPFQGTGAALEEFIRARGAPNYSPERVS